MRRNTVVSITALTFAAALGLTACSGADGTGGATGSDTGGSTGDTGAEAATVFKVAFNQQPNHPQYRALDAMGDRIKERTDGAYDLEIFPNETLGAQKETIELVQSGAIDFSVVASPLLENFNPDFVVFNLPFTFDSQDHQRETTNDPEIVSELYSSIDDQDLHVLGAFHGGVRSMYNAEKPIVKPEDLAGMKVRVIESDTNIEMIRLMGGTGTPMGMGEVYTAIQSGVIDAAENNELTYANVKHSEVAPYYSYTRHLMLPDYFITNPAVMESLPEDVQEIFAEELATAIEEEGDLWKTEIEVAKDMAIESGAKFNEVDADAFADVIRPLTESKLDNDFIREIHEKVRAAAE